MNLVAFLCVAISIVFDIVKDGFETLHPCQGRYAVNKSFDLL